MMPFHSLLLGVGALAGVGVEQALAQADSAGGDLNDLIRRHVPDGVLQRHLPRRDQADLLLRPLVAHVAQLLLLARVHLPAPTPTHKINQQHRKSTRPYSHG
eukprot:498321-Pyramimonas_sp.AAC.2